MNVDIQPARLDNSQQAGGRTNRRDGPVFDHLRGPQVYRFVQRAAFYAIAAVFICAGAASAQNAESIKINEKGFTGSEVCGKCHTKIYTQWKDGMHAQATSDPIFRASYMEAHYKSGGEAVRLCLVCHAPVSRQTKGYNLDVPPTSEGITCDFCHSVKGVNLSKSDPFVMDIGPVKYGPNKKGDVKQHKVAYSKTITEASFCASCHEYSKNGVAIMSTYTEWKNGPYADEGKPCQYCHMPESAGEISNNVTGERGAKIYSHNPAGGHSLTQLQKALALKIAKVDRTKDRLTVNVDLTNNGSGHRVPTGIPTRKLILYCEVKIPGGNVYKEKIIYEKVIFDKNGVELKSDADIMLGYGATIAKDNRIYPKETRREKFTFYVPEGKKASVTAWVDYLYTPVLMQETEMRVEMNRDQAESNPSMMR
ncbi:MAG: hypothetical protein HZB29_04285 [Nitrospinae bacterium]|nr:hypothetical protein [Nitrospinota bacterium]